MSNRTGTYFAFDGLGYTDPTKSDFKYYATVQGWHASKTTEFRFVNSHDKASSVRDASKMSTLKASIQQRLAASKNIIVMISSDTRKSGSLLSWEIEMAVDYYKLPLIIAYAGYWKVTAPQDLSSLWPNSLKQRINLGTAKAIHIPFKKEALSNAITRFTVNGEKLNSSLVFYTEESHANWGYI